MMKQMGELLEVATARSDRLDPLPGHPFCHPYPTLHEPEKTSPQVHKSNSDLACIDRQASELQLQLHTSIYNTPTCASFLIQSQYSIPNSSSKWYVSLFVRLHRPKGPDGLWEVPARRNSVVGTHKQTQQREGKASTRNNQTGMTGTIDQPNALPSVYFSSLLKYLHCLTTTPHPHPFWLSREFYPQQILLQSISSSCSITIGAQTSK